MDYVISMLGLIVTFIVAKGIMMSYELAAAELRKQEEGMAGARFEPRGR